MAKEFAKKLYNSKKWKTKRAEVFNRSFGLCSYCENTGEEVHHKIHLTPENIADEDIAFGDDNLVLLCKDCHFAQHRLEAFRGSVTPRITNNWTYFTEQGDIESIRVFVITGAPAGGKSTYVREHMGIGDLVIDLDMLRHCFSYGAGDIRSKQLHNMSPLILNIRDYIYTLIEQHNNCIDSKCIYIIATLPDPTERRELADRLGAELIHIDIDMKSCINNMLNDESRIDKDFQRQLIIKYFENYKK